MRGETGLWKYNKITGYWKLERPVDLGNAEQWLDVFQKDEPKESFVLSDRKPSRKPRMARSNAKIIESPHGYSKVLVQPPKAKRKEYPFEGYDEDKVMIGFDSVQEYIGAYLKQYDRPGFYLDGEHTAMPMGAFWRWVNDTKNKGKRIRTGGIRRITQSETMKRLRKDLWRPDYRNKAWERRDASFYSLAIVHWRHTGGAGENFQVTWYTGVPSQRWNSKTVDTLKEAVVIANLEKPESDRISAEEMGESSEGKLGSIRTVMSNAKHWQKSLDQAGIPAPPGGRILSLKYHSGSGDWYTRTSQGWFWWRGDGNPAHTEWKPVPQGPKFSLRAAKAMWKKGYVEGHPGAINAMKVMLGNTLAMLRALSWNHWTTHWQVKGESYYGDHLLFERLYDATLKEIDTLAEKMVSMFGPSAVDAAEQSKLTAFMLYQWSTVPDAIQRSFDAENVFQQVIAKTVAALDDMGALSLGLDDLLRTMANDHETAFYLLQQRNQTTRVARVLSAKAFGSNKSMRKYLKEHPKADPKVHSVTKSKPKSQPDDDDAAVNNAGDPKQLKSTKGRKRLFGKVLDKLSNTASWTKDKMVKVVKEEIQMWKDSGTALKKLMSGDQKWADLDSDERKHLVTKAVHTVIMAGLKGAIFAVVPPLAGFGVKQAISSVAEIIILKNLGTKVAAEGLDIDGFVQTVMSGVDEAIKQLSSGQIDDPILATALDAMRQSKLSAFTPHQWSSMQGAIQRVSSLAVQDSLRAMRQADRDLCRARARTGDRSGLAC